MSLGKKKMHLDNKWVDTDGSLHYGKKMVSINGFDVIECELCNFKHVTPIPTIKALETVYRNDYYQTEKTSYIDHYLQDKDWWDEVYKDRYEIFEKNLSVTSRKILDIGSGPGLFLNFGKERGWKTKGLEPSSLAAKYSIEEFKLDVDEVFFDSTSSQKLGKFDVINMGEVLEHLPNPKSIIDLSHSSLNDDGLLCIIVPNDFNPFQMVLTEAMGYKPWWVMPPHHLNYFNKNSLTLLIESCGFKVIHKETTFPIDIFLMMGKNYVDDSDLGRECHQLRKQFEINLAKSADQKLSRNLYQAFSNADIGREIVIIAKKYN